MDSLNIVSISFHTAGKIFDFDALEFELKIGDKVVVETERGRAMGKVVTAPRKTSPDKTPPKLKPILRIATEADLQMAEGNAQREKEAQLFCQQRVKQRNMDMKLVRAEYLFDGSKIIFYFTADGRVDFRELVRDLAQHFRTRIEMRQIGVRDEAKQVGGLGICGRELCCSSHLRDFVPVSVKMAKAQGLALNPTKISGQCGRLLCCLAYEYETYNEMKKGLPKCGKKVQLKAGGAEVISRDILAQKVTLSCNGERCQMHIDELQKEISEAANAPTEPAKKPIQQVKRNRPPRTDKNRNKPKETPQRPENKDKPVQEQANPQTPDTKDGSSPEKSKRRRRRPRRRTNRPNKPTENK